MNRDDIEHTIIGRKVSRRWVLQSAATVTAGVVAAGSVTLADTATVTVRKREWDSRKICDKVEERLAVRPGAGGGGT